MTTAYEDQRHLQNVTPVTHYCMERDHDLCPGTVDTMMYLTFSDGIHKKNVTVETICICSCHFAEQVLGGVKRWSD